ncbi:ATP-binding cassette domain-containing protein [Lachnoclostridium sp.]|uniref:ATP-binding cassette domain-containing protein n=1 Tax=Lachnoclostridium sp. TaxID=2028282 RepID=UPI00289783F5|nr:ATP-binding cassette domain-containing protein [Lachnoclostridium sp.]
MSNEIQIDKISKRVDGKNILQNVNMNIEKGDTIGFFDMGDGAKSVLFQILCGELTPDSGKVYFRGEQLGKFSETPRDVGIAIHPMGFIKEFNGYKNLKYIAGINGNVEDREIYEAMKMVGLKPESRTKVGEFSTRMLQKLSIAQAIMERQDIIIFDELFSKENNKNHRELCKILRLLKKQNITILLTSDKKEFIEKICDKGYMIQDGGIKENFIKQEMVEEKLIEDKIINEEKREEVKQSCNLKFNSL